MKRKIRTCICLLLSIMLLVPVLSVSAMPAPDTDEENTSAKVCYNDDFYYEITKDNTVTILLYKSEETTVTIPSEIDSLPVTSIGKWAFSNSPIQKITICEGITSISEEAFYNSSELKSVVLPESLKKVGMGLFRNCTNLERVTYRGDKSVLGPYMFYGCVRLININLKDNTTEIPVGAFAYCRRLNVIALPKRLQIINDYAFYNTALTSLVLPENVNYIGNLSFAENSSLTYISAKSSECDYVHEDAFVGCPANNPYKTLIPDVTIPQEPATVPDTSTEPTSSATEDVPTSPGDDSPMASDDECPCPDDTIKIFFANNKSWEQVYVYGFYDTVGEYPKDSSLGEYPGTEMTFLDTNENGEDIYYAIIPADIDYITFVEVGADNNRSDIISNDVLYDNIGFYLGEIISGSTWSYVTYSFAPDSAPPDNTTETTSTTVAPQPPVPEDEITIYFTANTDWKDVYIYGFYGEEGKPATSEWAGAYPGARMTYERTNEYGEKIYSFRIPADIDYIKFSDGSPYNRRTINIPNSKLHNNTGFSLTNVATSNKWDVSSYIYSPEDVIPDYYTIYFTANPNWENAYIFGFNGTEGMVAETVYPCDYPGMEMTFVEINKYGQNIYSCKVPSDIDYIKFSDGSSSNQRTVNIPNSELRQNIGFYLKSETGSNKWSVGTYVYMDGETTTPNVVLPTYGNPVPPTSPSTPSDDIVPNPERVYIIGDADSNHIINIDDATLILHYTDHSADIPEELLDAADTDRNGRITKDDALAIQNYICGLLTDTLINTPCNPDSQNLEAQNEEIEEDTQKLKAPDKGIAAGNNLILATKGSTITYRVSLTSNQVIGNIQATIRYDSSKLKLVRINSEEQYLSSDLMESSLCFPNLIDVVYNADTENEIRFNACSNKGYGFFQGETLAEFEFEVIDTSAYSEIKIDIQYMSDILGNHYFYSSKPVNEDAVSVNENLFGPDTLKPNIDFFVSDDYYFSPENEYIIYENQVAEDKRDKFENFKGEIASLAYSADKAGDVDNDDNVTIKDATLVQKFVAGILPDETFIEKNADVDTNGLVNIKDATEIQKFIAGLSSALSDLKNK